MSDLISRQVLDLWDRYKPTIAVDAIEYDRELKQLLGTNLASLGTDRAVKGFPIDADDLMLRVEEKYGFRSRDRLYDIIRKMPKYELASIQPDSICCKDCVKHNKGIGDIEEQPYGLRKHIMKDESCPLVSWRGKAQGHEFDYQFCVYGKRREVTT